MDPILSKQQDSRAYRIFLAVELPEQLRIQLAHIPNMFTGHGRAIKWTVLHQFHITVRFLGDVAPSRLGSVVTATEEACYRANPFTLRMGGIGAFPNLLAPRSLWAGLVEDEGLRALHGLATEVDRALHEHGFDRDLRPFKPHITLGRVRERIDADERAAIGAQLRAAHANDPFHGSFVVDHLVVMRSILDRAGPTYLPLHVAPLVATASNDM